MNKAIKRLLKWLIVKGLTFCQELKARDVYALTVILIHQPLIQLKNKNKDSILSVENISCLMLEEEKN